MSNTLVKGTGDFVLSLNPKKKECVSKVLRILYKDRETYFSLIFISPLVIPTNFLSNDE